ncbi:MAG: hypothetical protein JW895_08535 [Thermoleophilaceae bacterium]|nr:hypothetical protein [Thermoleophilaceae bacterium]
MLFLDTPPRAARRRGLALLASVCGLLAASPAAGAATRQVAPAGNDSGSCLSSPCRSLAYAYGQSAAGDVVRVAAGAYPSQTVPAGTKPVTFRGVPGAKLRQLDSAASNVVYDGLEVDGAFTKALTFHNSGDHSSFRNGRIGNVTDEKGALVSGTGFSFDNVVFHDVRVTDPSVHNECLYAIGVPGLAVRRSTFQNCATMDIFFTYGSWWSPLPPAYGGVTLENNVFGHTYKDDGTWHYYSLYVANTANGGGTVDGWVVRNNTFEIPANLEHAATGGSRWVGNLGSWECVSGMRYSRNVGKQCGATDRSVARATSTAALPAALGWIGGLDFRLTPGSPAIDAADPSDHPALDRDGFARTGRPDAGAHEFGAGPPRPGGAPPGGSPTSPGKRRLVRSARLRPRVICKHRRRGCARSARLSLNVTARSRIIVKVVRRRHGKRVRTLKLGLRKRPALRIRARGLKRGRYRVVVVATSATGVKASPRAFALRVR